MKKFIILPLAFVLTLCVLTGCRRADTPATTVPSTTATVPMTTVPPTTMPTTTPPTMPSTMTEPDMGDMMPGTEDTVNSTNGANQDPAGF